jgi:hypothetical protein
MVALLTTWQRGHDVKIQDEEEGHRGYEFPDLIFDICAVFVKTKGQRWGG